MLDALPPLEAAFYGSEANVVPPDDERSSSIFEELQERYGFLGGDSSE